MTPAIDISLLIRDLTTSSFISDGAVSEFAKHTGHEILHRLVISTIAMVGR
jgi:hypothetical protein